MGLLSAPKAPKGLLASAQKLQKMGNGGDSLLAHINTREAAMLRQAGGAGTVNPKTGLLQFEGTGGEGEGEGPGSDGPTGGSGPGGNAGPGSADGPGSSGGLTGHESATAVEGGQIPGTPDGTAAMNGIGDAAAMGQLGKFGQPTLGSILNGVINGFADNVNGVVQGKPEVIGKMAVNGLLGLTPLGAVNSISGILGGPTVGSIAMGALGVGAPDSSQTGASAGSPTAGIGSAGIGAAPSDGASNGAGIGGQQGIFGTPAIPGVPQAPGAPASPFRLAPYQPTGYSPITFGQQSRLWRPRGLLG